MEWVHARSIGIRVQVPARITMANAVYYYYVVCTLLLATTEYSCSSSAGAGVAAAKVARFAFLVDGWMEGGVGFVRAPPPPAVGMGKRLQCVLLTIRF